MTASIALAMALASLASIQPMAPSAAAQATGLPP